MYFVEVIISVTISCVEMRKANRRYLTKASKGAQIVYYLLTFHINVRRPISENMRR